MSGHTHDLTRWITYIRWRLTRMIVATALFVLGVSFVPYWWCSRQANAWYRGDAASQQPLARGVEAWVTKGLSRDDFHTGSPQFDGEWLFGSYLMAGFGFAQTALADPSVRERHTRLAGLCIERLLTPEVRAFDGETWRSDPVDSLDSPDHHAAFLGYFNLLLGLHRQLDPQSRFAALNDRITAALVRRLEASPIGLLESYPNETYPVDNCAVIASIAVHSRITTTDRRNFMDRCYRTLHETCIDRKSGLLIQAVYSRNGEPVDDPRGSGTALGLYFLSFANKELSADLYRAVRRELFDTVFGFGGVKEYPAHLKPAAGDIDSGPVVFGYGLSPTGFLISGARIHKDPDAFKRLFATAYACGAPYCGDGKMNFITGGSLGDAILFAMLTAGGDHP
jgi:hypothetical protein